MIPTILYGSNVVMVGNPFSILMSIVGFFFPILICAVVIKFLLNRRNREIPEDT
jgi:hypothetical protein